MLIDGISLVDSSVIANSHVESGTAFPSPPSLGRMFYLNAAFGGNEPGLYVYNGTAWLTGDITSVSVGSGLTGGGASGDISIGVDTAVIATKTYADSKVAIVQTNVNNLTAGTFGLGLVENKTSATIRSELTSANVTVALGFTPYNGSNPSGFINLGQARSGIGAGTGISYDPATGFVSLNATTTLVAEGANQYFTIARAAAAAPVQSVAGRTGAIVLTASDVAALPIAGGTLTGALTLNADPSISLGAATKQYVDTKAATTIAAANMDGGIF